MSNRRELEHWLCCVGFNFIQMLVSCRVDYCCTVYTIEFTTCHWFLCIDIFPIISLYRYHNIIFFGFYEWYFFVMFWWLPIISVVCITLVFDSQMYFTHYIIRKLYSIVGYNFRTFLLTPVSHPKLKYCRHYEAFESWHHCLNHYHVMLGAYLALHSTTGRL